MALLPEGFTLLNNENYDTWKCDVKVLLIDKGCWKFIEGKAEPVDPKAPRKEIDNYQLKKDRAFTTLYYAVQTEFRPLLQECSDGKKAWEILQKQFEPKTRARVIQLLDIFFNIRYIPGEEIGIFIARIKTAVKKLNDAGHQLDPIFQGFQIIRHLPHEFNGIVQLIYRWEDSDFTIDKIAEELIHEESRLKQMRSDKVSDHATAFNILDKNKQFQANEKISNIKPNFRCTKQRQINEVGPCYRCNRYGHLISQCKVKPRRQFKSKNSKEEKDRYNWVVDTGASTHFCNNRDLFLNFEEIDNIHVSLAEGKKDCTVYGKGTIKFAVKLNNDLNWIEMDNVLYNPNLRRNLLSGARLEKAGANFVGSKGKIWVYNSNWQKLFFARRIGGLYHLKPWKYETDKKNIENVYNIKSEGLDSSTLWHRRFCHINFDYIYDTSKNQSVNGLPKIGKPTEQCEVCVIAKTSRVSFKPLTYRRSKTPLQLVYLDVCGPLPVSSQGGGRYILSVIDDFSRFVTIYILKTKDEAFDVFKNYHKRMERLTKQELVCIRTDNGGEFCNNEFNAYLNQCGVKHEKTNAYTPEENSVCERYHRTILDGVKAMLKESKLEDKWWAEAAACFTHVWNRIGHKEKKTPFELFLKRKPTVSYFKVFGCKAYVGIPKQNRNKLQMRTKEGVMLGYAFDTKGYRIWLPEENRLIETCNVKFNEQKIAVDSILDPKRTSRNVNRYKSESESDEDGFEHEISDSSIHEQEPDQVLESPGKEPVETTAQKVTDLKWIRKPKERPGGDRTDIYYYIDGVKDRFRSQNDIRKYCETRNIEFEDYRKFFDFSPRNMYSGNVSFARDEGNEETSDEANIAEIMVPKSYEEAIKSKDSNKWKSAMEEEMKMMKDRKVWTLVDKPYNKKILGNRWVYTVKCNERNLITRYKARLVAQGFRQEKGEDFEDIYSPVVNFTIIRLFFAIFVGLLKWTHCIADINNAYLYAKLDEDLYMCQPKGFIEHKNKVCKLSKAIYGLRQSGRNWFIKLEEGLKRCGFEKLEWCNCAYKAQYTVILIYVDDLVIFGETKEYIDCVIRNLRELFDLKVLGKTKLLLGIEFLEKNGNLYIHQQTYIQHVYGRFKSFGIPITSLPITKGSLLSKLDCPYNENEQEEMKHIPYRSLLGCLAYIANRSRPDITYTVNLLSQFQENPGMKHWHAMLKLLGYVQNTKHYKINLSNLKNLKIRGYSDANYATNRDDRVSLGGLIIYIDNVPITWRTCKQKSVSLSTMEAEFIALAEASKEMVWVKNIINDQRLDLHLQECELFCDNKAAIDFSRSPVQNNRSKHIDVKFFFVRQLINDGVFTLRFVPSKHNKADILTKPIMKNELINFCTSIFGSNL